MVGSFGFERKEDKLLKQKYCQIIAITYVNVFKKLQTFCKALLASPGETSFS